MTEAEVENALGCSVCVCGDLETWHPECYAGKSHAQIRRETRAVLVKARVYLRRRAEIETAFALSLAAAEPAKGQEAS